MLYMLIWLGLCLVVAAIAVLVDAHIHVTCAVPRPKLNVGRVLRVARQAVVGEGIFCRIRNTVNLNRVSAGLLIGTAGVDAQAALVIVERNIDRRARLHVSTLDCKFVVVPGVLYTKNDVRGFVTARRIGNLRTVR